jgi:Orsellinic acid/F9775 biosynthesis cluster protein D
MPVRIVHDGAHGIAVCCECETALIPDTASLERHFRARPHRLSGGALKTTVQLVLAYGLKSVRELKLQKPRREHKCRRIQHLAAYQGYACLDSGCGFCTRRLAKIHDHMPKHKRKASEHKTAALWEECTLQTYFTAKGRIDYFVVVDEDKGRVAGAGGGPGVLTGPETELFAKLEQDYKDVKGDLEEQASIVHDFGDSRSERVPWLETTGFPYHLAPLRDEEIWSSYKLPPKREFDADA